MHERCLSSASVEISFVIEQCVLLWIPFTEFTENLPSFFINIIDICVSLTVTERRASIWGQFPAEIFKPTTINKATITLSGLREQLLNRKGLLCYVRRLKNEMVIMTVHVPISLGFLQNEMNEIFIQILTLI